MSWKRGGIGMSGGEGRNDAHTQFTGTDGGAVHLKK
jgi:hypothetical protein